MREIIFTYILGIIVIVLGIMNMCGNVKMLHSYHRKRVKEEDLKPFGKLVGIGTIIIGLGLIIAGVFFTLFYITKDSLFNLIGEIMLGVGLIVGLIICFHAMKKYNKGIF